MSHLLYNCPGITHVELEKLMHPLYELRIRTWRPYWFGCHKIWSDMSSRSIADLQLRRCKKINQGLPYCQIEENPIGYYLHLLMWFCLQSWVFQTLRGTSFAQKAMAGNTNALAASYSTNWWDIVTCFSAMEEHIIPLQLSDVKIKHDKIICFFLSECKCKRHSGGYSASFWGRQSSSWRVLQDGMDLRPLPLIPNRFDLSHDTILKAINDNWMEV